MDGHELNSQMVQGVADNFRMRPKTGKWSKVFNRRADDYRSAPADLAGAQVS
jgi:hypothetical protein